MRIEEFFGDWIKVIDKGELIKALSTLDNLYEKHSITPNKSDVFNAFKLCPLKDCVTVFLGLDLYPQKGVATGVLFGNKKETPNDSLSPSLEVIKDACIDFEYPHYSYTFDVTLESWGRQGVLMLNSALTTEVNKIGSHTMIWRPFISKLLRNLSLFSPGIIYVLFGSRAKSFKHHIIAREEDILTVEHPSFYARTKTRMSPKVFCDINRKLKGLYGIEIEWYKEY